MVLNRKEFAHYFNALKEGMGDAKSPLWAPEELQSPVSLWFVCVKPIGVSRFKWDYWNWCNSTLAGQVRCYSSDTTDKKEWWGFTNKDDIPVWMLKWM